MTRSGAMGRVPIPINSKSYLDAPAATNADSAGIFLNGFINSTEKKENRPGLILWKDLGTSSTVNGLFWSETLGTLIANSAGSTYKVSSDLTQTDLTTSLIGADNPIIHTEDNLRVIQADGIGKLTYTDGTAASTTEISNGIAPTSASHVVFFNQALFTFDTSSDLLNRRIIWSDIGDSLTWSDTNFLTAEAHPDKITALHTVSDVLLAFGTQTLEFYRAVGGSFTPIQRFKALKIGTISPYSIGQFGDVLFFVDHNKHVRSIDGTGNATFISVPWVDREIQGLSETSNAQGYVTKTDKGVYYVLRFPGPNKSWAYHIESESWSEWTTYDESSATNNIFVGQNTTQATDSDYNRTYLGSGEDSKIYIICKDHKDDDGSPIDKDWQTGVLDFGISASKRAFKIHLRIHRGEGVTDVTHEPTLSVEYRLNGTKQWQPIADVSLGLLGYREIHKTLAFTSKFQSAEFRFRTLESLDFSIGWAELEVRELKR